MANTGELRPAVDMHAGHEHGHSQNTWSLPVGSPPPVPMSVRFSALTSIISLSERGDAEVMVGLEEIQRRKNDAGGPAIPARAFANCANLNTVVVPTGVTSIGKGAFLRCK